jgi:hypothetical protein
VNDAVWANANVYATETFFDEASDTPLTAGPDIKLEWRALWDNTNLYVMAKINDDAIINSINDFGPDSGNWEDDGIEFYIDAQNVDNNEYAPGQTDPDTGLPLGPDEPTYQFTALAGWTPTIANDPNTPQNPRPSRDPSVLPNTSFTWGINSYDGNQVDRRYPQTRGSATSSAVTANPAGGFDWSFEASFPWEALEETPADILARNGIFGLGVAYNDDDDGTGRDNQYMWATPAGDLWHISASFPDVQLVEPASLPGDYNADGAVNAADYVLWRKNPAGHGGDPAGYNTWRTNFGRTAGAGSGLGGGSAAPEPATLGLLALLFAVPWLLRRRRL